MIMLLFQPFDVCQCHEPKDLDVEVTSKCNNQGASRKKTLEGSAALKNGSKYVDHMGTRSPVDTQAFNMFELAHELNLGKAIVQL